MRILWFRKFFLLAIGIGLFVFFLLRFRGDLTIPFDLIRFEWLVLLLLSHFVLILLKTIRWRLLLGLCGIRLSLPRVFGAVSAGYFLGLVTPATLGELGRVLTVDVKKTLGLTTVLFEKMFDVFVIFIISLLGLVAYWTGVSHLSWMIALALIVLVSTRLIFHDLFQSVITATLSGLGRVRVFQLGSRISPSQAMITQLFSTPWVFIFSLVISTLMLTVSGLQFAMICMMLGIRPSLELVSVGFFLPYMAGVIFLIPMSLGVMEWTSPAILTGLFGVSGDLANLSMVFYRLLVTLPLVIIGFICYAIMVLLKRYTHTQGNVPPAAEKEMERVESNVRF